jgi:hypothetical protein
MLLLVIILLTATSQVRADPPKDCQLPVFADIVFLLETSSSQVNYAPVHFFENMTHWIANQASQLTLSSTDNRVGFVTFAGIFDEQPDLYQVS